LPESGRRDGAGRSSAQVLSPCRPASNYYVSIVLTSGVLMSLIPPEISRVHLGRVELSVNLLSKEEYLNRGMVVRFVIQFVGAVQSMRKLSNKSLYSSNLIQ
jgi:hypothetical protein